MTSIFKSETRKFLEREDVRLNDIPRLAQFLGSGFDKRTYGFDILYERPQIVSFLDQRIEDLKSVKYKEFIEYTGDADFAQSRKRMDDYQSLIRDHGVKMRMMMTPDSWSLGNAEILQNAGVEVRHAVPPYELHTGVIGRMLMFTLHRQPTPGAQKIVGEPQKAGEAEYMMLATNNVDYVDYTQDVLEGLWKKSTPHQEVKESQNEFSHNMKSLKKLGMSLAI